MTILPGQQVRLELLCFRGGNTPSVHRFSLMMEPQYDLLLPMTPFARS
jgi:hypothetical protein